MKHIAAIVTTFLLCVASTAHAQMNLLTGAGGKFKAASVVPATFTPGAAVTPQRPGFSGTSSTFNNVNGGVNFPNGAVVVIFIGQNQSGATLSSVTVGGSAIAASAVSGATDSTKKCQLYQATMTSSQTDTVTLNYSSGLLDYVGVVTGYFQNLVSSTATASQNETYANQADPQFPSGAGITVPASGFGLSFIMSKAATPPSAYSWQTTTPSFITAGAGDIYAVFTGSAQMSVGSAHTTTSGAGWIPKVSGVTTAASFVSCMSAATWN